MKICSRLMNKFQRACRREGLSSASQSQLKQNKKLLGLRRRLGNELVQRLSDHLDACEFEMEAFCVKHGRNCCWTPRAEDGLKNFFWVEIAGSTCVAWSTAGSLAGWLHPSTLPCLVWAYSMRFAEPDAILHECVPGFMEASLRRILDGRRRRGRQGPPPRNPFGRCSRISTYHMTPTVFCPTDFGIPSRRRRKCTIFCLRSSCALSPSPI